MLQIVPTADAETPLETAKYRHLTQEQRYTIEALKKKGHTQKFIAETLEVSPATICRELQRNAKANKQYASRHADRRAQDRASAANSRLRCATDEAMKPVLVILKATQASPEQIVGRLKREGTVTPSSSTIYRYIDADKEKLGQLYLNLRRQGKKRRKSRRGQSRASKIPGRVSIHKRPEAVDKKKEFGHFEADCVVGAHHQGAIVTVVERVTKKGFTQEVPCQSMHHVTEAIKNMLAPYKNIVKTITFDNGSEFFLHLMIAAFLECDTYFCDPYCSWQRGLNEHTNGLLRQYLPKGTSFVDLDRKKLQGYIDRINNRPRKVLDFVTPNEAFDQALAAANKQA
jgi:transposase, IS30 family